MNTLSFEIKGHRILFDERDLLLVGSLKWRIHKPGRYNKTLYVVASPKQFETVALHRLILDVPIGTEVDHINLNGLDNRRANLRLCSSSQNKWNVGKRNNNTSGYTGVTWHSRARKWQAQYKSEGRDIYIGTFDTAEEAHDAYIAAVTPLRNQFARTT